MQSPMRYLERCTAQADGETRNAADYRPAATAGLPLTALLSRPLSSIPLADSLPLLVGQPVARLRSPHLHPPVSGDALRVGVPSPTSLPLPLSVLRPGYSPKFCCRQASSLLPAVALLPQSPSRAPCCWVISSPLFCCRPPPVTRLPIAVFCGGVVVRNPWREKVSTVRNDRARLRQHGEKRQMVAISHPTPSLLFPFLLGISTLLVDDHLRQRSPWPLCVRTYVAVR